jgi:hypothetical protein
MDGTRRALWRPLLSMQTTGLIGIIAAIMLDRMLRVQWCWNSCVLCCEPVKALSYWWVAGGAHRTLLDLLWGGSRMNNCDRWNARKRANRIANAIDLRAYGWTSRNITGNACKHAYALEPLFTSGVQNSDCYPLHEGYVVVVECPVSIFYILIPVPPYVSTPTYSETSTGM